MPTQEQLTENERINQQMLATQAQKRAERLAKRDPIQPLGGNITVGGQGTGLNTGPVTPVAFGGQGGQTGTGLNPVGNIQQNGVGSITTTIPQSWDTVGKQKDPTQVSNYLNTQSGFKTTVSGNTVTGTKNGVQTTWIYDGANWVTKPTIATGDNPVIGNEPATNVVTTPGGFDTYEAMTPEQRYRKATEIYMKGGKDITDEEKKFMAYTQFQGATGKDVFGLKTTKSSGTTTYSTELIQPGENIASSERQSDGTYKVTYKDGTTQTTTSEPSTTVFPEGTPEYFAQKKAEEGEKRIQVLTEQVNKAEEKRKKDTADLVAKYGENIATQFQNQKAEIEANGAKRMDALNTGLSFSGFGRSTLALEKRDEIAKNIETTINQAKAKADLELMAYRMEREGADQVAIAGMRKSIADVQQKIDDANYANQLKIIELNQQNATTGAEAMNNLLATISNADELMKDIDFEKSALHGYLVDKTTGKTMFDSQGRPIKFENSASGLEPNEIQTFSELLKTGKVDIEGLKKLGLNPAEIADISKDYAIQNNTYVPPVSVSDFIAKEEGFRDKAYWDVNGWAVGYGQHAINGKPVVEGQTITKQEADADLANRVANARFNKLITVPLSESQKAALYSLEHNVGGGVWQFASIKPMIEAINKGDFNLAADILVQSGVGTRNASTKEVLGGLVARRQREADLLRQSGGGGIGQDIDMRAITISKIAFGKTMSDKERESVIGILKKYPNVPNNEIALLARGMYLNDPKNTDKAIEYINLFNNMETPPSGYETQIATYINKGDFAGLNRYVDNQVEIDLKKRLPADEFISNSSYTTGKQNTDILIGLIDRNQNKIGAFDGRVSDLLKKVKDDPEYQQIKTLLSMSVADVRRKFAGSAVTDTEMRALEDFIGGRTTMSVGNLKTYLKTIQEKTTRQYENQRSLYGKPDNVAIGTTPTGQTGGEVVESDWWTVN